MSATKKHSKPRNTRSAEKSALPESFKFSELPPGDPRLVALAKNADDYREPGMNAALNLADEVARCLTQAEAICAVVGAASCAPSGVVLPDDAVLNAMWAACDLIKQAQESSSKLHRLASAAKVA